MTKKSFILKLLSTTGLISLFKPFSAKGEIPINNEIYTLETGKMLMDGFCGKNPLGIQITTYLVSGTEEQLVKKEMHNLLAIIAKHRESKTGVDMIVEFNRLKEKYDI